jgi:hypothetical protein
MTNKIFQLQTISVKNIEVPHWSKFSFQDPISGITLRGGPDEMFYMNDRTLAILDYKTARFPEKQDNLLPLYRAQLGGYRWIALKLGMGETSLTGLIYYDPQTNATIKNILGDGFNMEFTAIIHEVKTNLDEIEHFLMEAKRITDMDTPPNGIEECKDCKLIEEIKAMELI